MSKHICCFLEQRVSSSTTAIREKKNSWAGKQLKNIHHFLQPFVFVIVQQKQHMLLLNLQLQVN